MRYSLTVFDSIGTSVSSSVQRLRLGTVVRREAVSTMTMTPFAQRSLLKWSAKGDDGSSVWLGQSSFDKTHLMPLAGVQKASDPLSFFLFSASLRFCEVAFQVCSIFSSIILILFIFCRVQAVPLICYGIKMERLKRNHINGV